MTTKETTEHNPAGEWHQFDADGAVLGRLATEVATLLTGKHRADWAANVTPPVYVVITNTDKVAVTGKKEDQKLYYRHSGYPGGLRDSRKIVEAAVSGMLPKNNLRREMMLHLKLYKDESHPHAPQLTTSKKDNS